jgi:hypothetical protein
MYTGVRSVQAMPGKLGELIPIAKDIAAVVRRVGGTDIKVATAFGGNVAELAWIGTYDTLSQFEDILTKAMADAEYRALLKKLEPILIPGSGRDQFWRHV